MKIKSILRNNTLINIFSLFAVQGVTYIVPLITLPYLVRVLGASNYGVYGFSLAITQYLILITDYGFNLTATRKIAMEQNDKSKVSAIFWSVTFCKFILLLISLVLVFVLSQYIDLLQGNKLVVYACFGLVIGNVLFPVWLFQGKESLGLSSLSNIIPKLIAVPLIFIFVRTTNDAWIAALISSLTAIIGGVISITIIHHKRWIRWVPASIDDMKRDLYDGWHIFMSTASISLYTTSITVILGILCGPVVVGYFTAADKIRQAVQGLINPVTQACYPRINNLFSSSPADAYVFIRKLLSIQSIATLILSFILLIGAGKIIYLMYGVEFEKSVSVLMLMSFCPFMIGLSNIFGIHVLVVMGFKEVFSKILLLSGIFCIIIMIPASLFYQENGAAFSILLTEMFVTLLMIIVVRSKKIPLFKRSE